MIGWAATRTDLVDGVPWCACPTQARSATGDERHGAGVAAISSSHVIAVPKDMVFRIRSATIETAGWAVRTQALTVVLCCADR